MNIYIFEYSDILIINLIFFFFYLANLTKLTQEDYENLDDPPLPETLVRMRLDE